MLTELEHEALALSGQLAGKVHRIIGEGPQAENDWAEMAHHIHVLQRTILSQAAGREYPELYRLLGQSLTPT